MIQFAPAAMLSLVLSSVCIAAGSDLDDLLDRLEQNSRNQPVLAHIDTLLAAAELLPIKKFAERRRQFLDSALTLLPSVDDVESRYFYFAATPNFSLRRIAGKPAKSACAFLHASRANGGRTTGAAAGSIWSMPTRAAGRQFSTDSATEPSTFQARSTASRTTRSNRTTLCRR